MSRPSPSIVSSTSGRRPITETYFPRVRPLMDAASQNIRRLQADCGICHQRMSPDPLMLDDDICTGIVVLSCGHMVGAECAAKWLEQSKRCPCCNKENVHPGCGHVAAVRRFVDPTSLENVGGDVPSVPMTIPEHGGFFFDKCIFCELYERMKALAEAFGSDLSEEAHQDIGDFFCIQIKCLTEVRRQNLFFSWDEEAKEVYTVQSHEEPSHIIKFSVNVRKHLADIIEGELDEREGSWETEALTVQLGIMRPVDELNEETLAELGITGKTGWPLPRADGSYMGTKDYEEVYGSGSGSS